MGLSNGVKTDLSSCEIAGSISLSTVLKMTARGFPKKFGMCAQNCTASRPSRW